jgi:hypothetical protein
MQKVGVIVNSKTSVVLASDITQKVGVIVNSKTIHPYTTLHCSNLKRNSHNQNSGFRNIKKIIFAGCECK